MDRHDNTARVFRKKLKSLMNFMTKHEVFGSVRCWMYSVEWRKRGLPHAHILVWLYNKITSNEIDDVICAEIPYANVDKDLYEVVTKNMIHGPCGSDMAVFGVQPERSDRNAVLHIDEIAQYQAGRYISSNEAVWRILSFPIYERSPAVVHLAVHLENGQPELWEKYKSYMDEDILHRLRSENSNMNMDFTAEIYNEALIMIEDMCLQIANKVLSQLGMPPPNRSAAASRAKLRHG
ncbi:unnamed protein product [Onchocerca ochengi]|uniref:Helitron_like_N domain-containing protein n=1 Tax=Onchocerca ochengi TaxID=42157 RepID=A0A182EMS7_ONCOC|nr:unnamed protein product [Onchocerca ochengi]